MKNVARFVIETALMMLLAGGILIVAIVAAQHIFSDEKSQYFVIGYYFAIHNDLVRWIWKKIHIDKTTTE